MTSPLPSALRRTLAESATRLFWNDPVLAHTSYETRNYGAIHVQRHGDVAEDLIPFAFAQASLPAGGDLWLVRTPFCAPRIWWQALLAHPGETVVPVFVHRGRLIIGPAFVNGGRLCPTCAALRLGQAFPHPRLFVALLAGPALCCGAEAGEPLRALLCLESLAPFASSQQEMLRAGHLASLHLTEGPDEVRWHRLIPLPGDHPLHEVKAPVVAFFGIPDLPWPRSPVPVPSEGEQPLADELAGPLLSTTKHVRLAEEPELLCGYETITGQLGIFTRWQPDVSGSGLSFSEEQARWASLGEAVERYSGNYVDRSRLVSATSSELVRTGQPHVPVSRFLPFTHGQRTSPGWPFAAFSEAQCIPWIRAHVLGAPGETALLPAESVFLNLTRMTGQQSLFPMPLAGIAAHRGREEALTAALLELIERDATICWWNGGLPALHIADLPQDLAAQVERGVPDYIRQWFLLLETDMPSYVVAGCLHDRKHDLLTVGFAARPHLADALRKATAEAWQLRNLSHNLLNPHSPLWQEIRCGRLPMPVRRFRADRRYREEFREDCADMHQLSYSLQFYLDPATHPAALSRLCGEPCPYEALAARQAREQDVVERCVMHLEQRGEQVYRVDLSTPDMQELGFTTVRAVCPGLIGNTPAAFPPLAHPRLQKVLRGRAPCLIPMPHA
jgi:ribosomal protein S12 methylthiotransferase accessory factor